MSDFHATCPACHGRGSFPADAYGFYEPPEPCGWCDGRGDFGPDTRTMYYRTLGYLRAAAAQRKAPNMGEYSSHRSA